MLLSEHLIRYTDTLRNITSEVSRDIISYVQDNSTSLSTTKESWDKCLKDVELDYLISHRSTLI